MRPHFTLLLLLLLQMPASGAPAAVAPAQPDLSGRLSVRDGLQILEIWGTPRERGFAQGYLLAREIVTGFDDGIGKVLKGRPGLYEGKLVPLAGMGFSFSEAETEELKGILDGIQKRLSEKERQLIALGRAISLVDLKILNTFGDWYALGCSSAAVWGGLTGDGTPALVRNFDFPTFDMVLGHQHLKVVAPSSGEAGSHGWAGLSHPGSVGAVTAMSRDGVFVAIHDVGVRPEMKDFLQGNVPRLLAVKRIAETLPPKGAVEAALGLCRSWNTLYGNNFMVATPLPGEGLPAGVVEYDTREDTDKGAVLRGPDTPDGQSVVCSNHHRLRGSATCGRYDALAGGCAEEREGPFDVAALFKLGERAAVPGAGTAAGESRIATLHQVVALTGAKRLHIRVVSADGNIRDAKSVEIDVVKCVEGATKGAEAGK